MKVTQNGENQRMNEKMKCKHPENYGNDCNGDTCPTRDYEIMIALAEGTCEWGEWEKEET